MAAPAEPILASNLWKSHLVSHKDRAIAERPAKRKRLATGLPAIDTALHGGVDYGAVTCISAESDAGASEIILSLLVTHLVSEPNATATVVDATLSFNAMKFHGMLVQALQGRGRNGEEGMRMLDRLRIMKIFDFVGLTECVTEVREELEGLHRSVATRAPPKGQPAPRGTISDSESEEMLDTPSPPPSTALPDEPRKTDGLLIIDGISQVTSPLIKSNHALGQALLDSFMRTLSHLTQTNNLCTVIRNSATVFSSQQSNREEPPSIFSSCTLQPALGKSFTYLLDLHLLAHLIPRTTADASVVNGGRDQAGPSNDRRDADGGSVIEVLQDRHGGRVGKWAAFAVETDGRLRVRS